MGYHRVVVVVVVISIAIVIVISIDIWRLNLDELGSVSSRSGGIVGRSCTRSSVSTARIAIDAIVIAITHHQGR